MKEEKLVCVLRLMNEGRCDERLKDKIEESTCLTYTGLYDKTRVKLLFIISETGGSKTPHTHWVVRVSIQ